jgi:hypothetical protein
LEAATHTGNKGDSMKKFLILSILALAFIATGTPKANAMTSCDDGWQFYIVAVGPGFQPMASCGGESQRISWFTYVVNMAAL